MKSVSVVLLVLLSFHLHGQTTWESVEGKLKGKASLNFGSPAEEYQFAQQLAHYFHEGGEKIRPLAFEALAGWSSKEALPHIFEIYTSGNKTYEQPAYEAFMEHMVKSAYPDEQKVLLYRKWYEVVKSPNNKRNIISRFTDLHTFPALVFLSEAMEEKAQALNAANAILEVLTVMEKEDFAWLGGTWTVQLLSNVKAVFIAEKMKTAQQKVEQLLARLKKKEGFEPIFNGRDLQGWQGLVKNPIARNKMSAAELARAQEEANRRMEETWSVRDGAIWFNGKGDNLCTVKKYADFEMWVDWLITKEGDSGIYLRGTPQVQIWDTTRVDVGAQVGSGGLYNNQEHESKPLVVADNPVNDWNTFHIVMKGELVSVWLNGILVVDEVVMENYWDRSIPIFTKEAIELQAHGTDLGFRNIFVRELSEE